MVCRPRSRPKAAQTTCVQRKHRQCRRHRPGVNCDGTRSARRRQLGERKLSTSHAVPRLCRRPAARPAVGFCPDHGCGSMTRARRTIIRRPAPVTRAMRIGWAVGGGMKINFPMIGPGDYFSAQVNYAQGATGYPNNVGGAYALFNGNGSYGFGVVTDAVYTTGNGEDLTTAWGVNAAYEHFWNKRWQTSVYGALCRARATTARPMPTVRWLRMRLASRGMTVAQWLQQQLRRTGTSALGRSSTSTPDLYRSRRDLPGSALGVHEHSRSSVTAAGAQPPRSRTVGDQSAWMAEFRFHRNFYP